MIMKAKMEANKVEASPILEGITKNIEQSNRDT